MFFKNLTLYRLTQAVPAFADAEALMEALETKPHREPASQEMATYGFVAPFKGEIIEQASGFILLAAKKTERILPGSVIRDELKEKIDRIESEQARKVYKRERDQIKDELIQELLPRTFKRSKVTFAMIMPAQGLIVVDTGSAKNAEDLLSTLREVIGSLPVRPVSTKIAPVATLTEWIKTEKAADDFYVLDECQLSDTHEDGGTVACKRQDLTSDEIQMHVSTGKLVTKLSISWQAKLHFSLDDKLSVRRLKFEDILVDQAEADGGDDAHGQLIASLIIMGGTLVEFIPALLEAFGGEEMPQGLGEDLPASVQATRTDREEIQIDAFDGEVDALYSDAVAFVRESNRPAISAVQTKFKIAFNRAARLIERMETEGVVTGMNTNGGREVIAA